MLPEKWIPKELEELATFKSGGTPSKQHSEYWNGGLPWISGKDLKSHLLSGSIDTLTKAGYENAKIAPVGASLVLVRGMTLLKEFPVGYATKPMAFNQDIKAMVAKEVIEPLFLSYLLIANSHKIRQLVTTAGHGTGRLETELLKSYPINLPPLNEQTKIAQILSTWDQAIATTKKLIENSKAQKKALMQQLLTGKKRLPGFSREWQLLKASEIFKTVSIKKKPEEQLLSVTQDQGVLPRSLLERKVVMPEGSTSGYKFVVPGNFIISLRSFQGGLEYSEYQGLVSPAYTVLEPITEISDRYYRQYYKSYEFIGRLAVAVIGIRDGKQVSYNDFSFLKLPYPPLKEQEAIASVLDTADAQIDNLRGQLKNLKDQKKALMQQLLTGKRRVQIGENSTP